jgi:hypothetical protein
MAKPIATVAALALFTGGTFLAPPLFWVFAAFAFGAYHFMLEQFSNADNVERFRKTLADAEANFNRANVDGNIAQVMELFMKQS